MDDARLAVELESQARCAEAPEMTPAEVRSVLRQSMPALQPRARIKAARATFATRLENIATLLSEAREVFDQLDAQPEVDLRNLLESLQTAGVELAVAVETAARQAEPVAL